jgi:uroporphyrinogen decarboxylase
MGKIMNSRERIKTIIAGGEPDRCGFWLGNPDPAPWPILHKYFGTETQEQLRLKLKDDFRWICPQWDLDCYKDPQGKPMFDLGLSENKKSLGQPGPFANTKNISEIEDYRWPDAKYLDFSGWNEKIKQYEGFYIASGFWTCFYHNLMDMFGMESYLVNMFLNKELLHYVTDKVCQFYYDANEKFFDAAGNTIDAFFFGNDFGTQLDLICGLEQFDEFILPWFRKFTKQAHDRGYQTILHSCGSVFKVIDRLIDMETDCLHPLQAKAANMNAEKLAKHFKGKIAFLGGIDTQDLLVNGTADEVKQDVLRVKKAFGSFIISPSHEAVLPNVPPENIEAMAEVSLRELT